jgi:hypothetical protein
MLANSARARSYFNNELAWAQHEWLGAVRASFASEAVRQLSQAGGNLLVNGSTTLRSTCASVSFLMNTDS